MRALESIGSGNLFVHDAPAGHAPLWPPGLQGSISHSSGLAVAAVGEAVRFAGVGVDCERLVDYDCVQRLSSTVLHPDEPPLPERPEEASRLFTIIYSIKESVYKALSWKHPDDGTIDYLGRNDFQVKIRGFRIEPGEIEVRLAAYPGVRQAVVVARQDEPDDTRLVAYVVAEGGANVAAADLREHLAGALPDHMIPSAFVLLDELPLTPNRKVDRNALPRPDAAAMRRGAFEEPRGASEIAVARIWRHLLQLDHVGRHDNFFEIGGHSLLAVQVVSRLQRALSVKISVREIFARPTLAGFAAVIDDRTSAARHANLVPIRSAGRQRPLFLVHPGEGQVGYARDLLPWLDPDLPVYGLAATGFVAGEAVLRTVPEMAEAYLESIRHIQAQGPYRLAGWSAGGIIAYEIAAQLLRSGERADFLGLIDTASRYEPLCRPPVDPRDGGPLDAAAIVSWLPGDTPDAVRDGLMDLAGTRDAAAVLAHCQTLGLIPHEIDLAAMRSYLAVRDAISQAMAAYRLPPPPALISLFVAADENRSDPTLGWRSVAGDGLTTIPIAGTHYSITKRPNVENLGTSISAALAGSEFAHGCKQRATT